MKKIAVSVLAVALLASCNGGGGDDSSGNGDNPSSALSPVSGVAAVGAPINGGTVELKCASGATASATTAATGTWAINTLRENDYPCAVRVSGGTQGNLGVPAPTYYSVALKGGNVNITPFTDLMTAALVNEVPHIWFQNVTSDQLKAQVTEASLASALTEFVAGMDTISGAPNIPQGFNPITTVFKAEDNDEFDELLDQYRTTIAEMGLPHSSAVGSLAAGRELDALYLYSTAYTYPVTQGPIHAEYAGILNTITIKDPKRGTRAGEISSDGQQTVILGGEFSGIALSAHGEASIAQLCVPNGGTQKGIYVYINNTAMEVVPSQLKGRDFAEYRNCALAGVTRFNEDGTVTYEGQGGAESYSAEQVAQLFSQQGLKVGNAVSRIKAYKARTDDGDYHYLVKTGSADPFVDDAAGTSYVYLGEEQPN